MRWLGGRSARRFLTIIIPICGSILQAGTCKILSFDKNPRWSRVWQYMLICCTIVVYFIINLFSNDQMLIGWYIQNNIKEVLKFVISLSKSWLTIWSPWWTFLNMPHSIFYRLSKLWGKLYCFHFQCHSMTCQGKSCKPSY